VPLQAPGIGVHQARWLTVAPYAESSRCCAALLPLGHPHLGVQVELQLQRHQVRPVGNRERVPRRRSFGNVAAFSRISRPAGA